MDWLKNYIIDRGIAWPSNDFQLRDRLEETMVDIDLAVGFCKQHRSVVQAGGHCGLWPRKLSGLFDTVYTFEPDSVNFVALTATTGGLTNVIRFQAVLGQQHQRIGLERNHGKNSGAHYVKGKGVIPVLAIDDLAIDDCDLIYLDVEGAEIPALLGAKKTIEQSRPVIAFEDKGLSKRYGFERGKIVGWLRGHFGYSVAAEGKSDTVMVAG